MVGTPCVTVRRNTEREITVEVGANRLVPADALAIREALGNALVRRDGWERPERWDDEVASRVVSALESGVLPLSGY